MVMLASYDSKAMHTKFSLRQTSPKFSPRWQAKKLYKWKNKYHYERTLSAHFKA